MAVGVRAVLFDVGGPLDTEIEHERLIDAAIRGALASEGLRVSGRAYERAARLAVESFAPDTYKAIIWRLARQDAATAEAVYARFRELAGGGLFEPREGMAEVLARLRGRGILLGLAANQPAAAIDRLDAHGLGRSFHHREVSATHGYRKPDVRLFLRACAGLGVAPSACIMVGDRIDNDIAPARLLGMRAIRFVTGRHAAQQPRSRDEVPDAEVMDVPGLEAALWRMIEGE